MHLLFLLDSAPWEALKCRKRDGSAKLCMRSAVEVIRVTHTVRYCECAQCALQLDGDGRRIARRILLYADTLKRLNDVDSSSPTGPIGGIDSWIDKELLASSLKYTCDICSSATSLPPSPCILLRKTSRQGVWVNTDRIPICAPVRFLDSLWLIVKAPPD